MSFVMKLTIALALAAVAACGQSSEKKGTDEHQPPPGPPVPEVFEFKAPEIISFALNSTRTDGTLQVGDWIQIFGKDFVPPKYGATQVKLSGYFTPEDTKAVESDLTLQDSDIVFENSGRIKFRVAPNVIFDPEGGERIGAFKGTVTVANVVEGQTLPAGKEIPFEAVVGPSLVMAEIRPTDSDCRKVVSDTIEGSNLNITAKAIGFQPATESHPLNIAITVDGRDFQIWGAENIVDLGPLELNGPGQDMNPEKQLVTFNYSTPEGNDVKLESNGSLVSGDEVYANGKQFRLTRLTTRDFPERAAGKQGSHVVLSAYDSAGHSASFVYDLNIWKPMEYLYTEKMYPVEREAPENVMDCVPGGLNHHLSYSESEDKSYSRSVGRDLNGTISVTLGLPKDPFVANATLSTSVGFNVNESVSTSEHEGINISAELLPGSYGTGYRQTTKYVHVVDVTGHSSCGQSEYLGIVVIEDFRFAREIATGSQCLPESKLPPAEHWDYDFLAHVKF